MGIVPTAIKRLSPVGQRYQISDNQLHTALRTPHQTLYPALRTLLCTLARLHAYRLKSATCLALERIREICQRWEAMASAELEQALTTYASLLSARWLSL
jgi:hypothetical protein